MSLLKKLKAISKTGIDPIIEGKKNYNNPTPEIESLAKKRAEECYKCLVDEPVDFLQIEDKRIPELNKKMCDKCGCAAAYLMRQNIKKCQNWTE